MSGTWTPTQHAKFKKTIKAKKAATSIPLEAIPDRAPKRAPAVSSNSLRLQIVLELLRTIQKVLQ